MYDPIMIFGPPRSRTSLVAGILHHLGVSMGETLVPPTDANPTGYYEDAYLQRLYDEVNNGKIDPGDGMKMLFNYIERRKKTGQRWGFKTLRYLHTLPYFIDRIPDCRILLTTRDPQDVQVSIARTHLYQGYPWPDAGHIARDMYQAVLSAIYNRRQLLSGRTMVVDTDALLSEPHLAVPSIAAFCDIPMPYDRTDLQQFVVLGQKTFPSIELPGPLDFIPISVADVLRHPPSTP